MIAETVAFLKKQGREVLYDAEHFFDSYGMIPAYSLATIKAAHDAGADLVVLCDTNGGSLPEFVEQATREAIAALGTARSASIRTMTRGLGVANALAAIARRARCRCRERSMATASAWATATSSR